MKPLHACIVKCQGAAAPAKTAVSPSSLSKLCLIAPLCILLQSSLVMGADTTSGSVAVYSAISPAYTRTKLADGSFKPEYYAFGEGGNWGGWMDDFSIDHLKFTDIARSIAPSLAGKNYLPVPTKEPGKTDLLIMVYWGTTYGTADRYTPEHTNTRSVNMSALPDSAAPMAMYRGASLLGSGQQQQGAAMRISNQMAWSNWWSMLDAFNKIRDSYDYQNAMVLGYQPAISRYRGLQGTALTHLNQDILDDVEENRYFVVLIAYDFQLLLKHKQRKIMWETRFSIRERGAEFDKELGTMAKFASRYYGVDSDGLIRKSFHQTKVTLGETTLVEYEPEKKK